MLDRSRAGRYGAAAADASLGRAADSQGPLDEHTGPDEAAAPSSPAAPVARAAKLWLVVPSHPLWFRGGIARDIAEWTTSQESIQLWSLACQTTNINYAVPTIGVCWKTTLQHIYLRVRD